MQVCNHPALSYPPDYGADQAELLRQCGKLCMLDRLLIKLHRTGHRVLLFSTMTRLLDLLEAYLRWRRFGLDGSEHMAYARIDGGTALEDRSACCTRVIKHVFCPALTCQRAEAAKIVAVLRFLLHESQRMQTGCRVYMLHAVFVGLISR